MKKVSAKTDCFLVLLGKTGSTRHSYRQNKLNLYLKMLRSIATLHFFVRILSTMDSVGLVVLPS